MDEVIGKVKQRFSKEGQEDYTDGYSVETSNWRFNIRPSNTEPLLRLNIEAKERNLINEVKKEVEDIIYLLDDGE